MIEQPVTPMTYLAEMAAMSWRHGQELGAAAACATALVAIAFVTFPAHALFVLAPAIVAVLLFEAAAAAWRLHRVQRIVLATTRSLLDLSAVDRVDLERHLETRYRRREARIHERNAVRLERLAGEIDALQTEVAGCSHRRVAM